LLRLIIVVDEFERGRRNILQLQNLSSTLFFHSGSSSLSLLSLLLLLLLLL